MLIVWDPSSSIVNTGPLKVLIIKVCHCNVLCFLVQHVANMQLRCFEVDLRSDSNDSSPMCITCNIITKLFELFLHRS